MVFSCALDAEKNAENEILKEDYANKKTAEMRCYLNNMPYAFPRTDYFPMAWKLIHSIVYDFLCKLGLENTMMVFTAESSVDQSKSLLESGWFLKSFVMGSDFHSVLMFLLSQFERANDRITEIVLAEKCRSGTADDCECQNCQRAVERMAQSVIEQREADEIRIHEAQQVIEEQRQNECRMLEARQDAVCNNSHQQERRSVERDRRRSCDVNASRRTSFEGGSRHRRQGRRGGVESSDSDVERSRHRHSQRRHSQGTREQTDRRPRESVGDFTRHIQNMQMIRGQRQAEREDRGEFDECRQEALCRKHNDFAGRNISRRRSVDVFDDVPDRYHGYRSMRDVRRPNDWQFRRNETFSKNDTFVKNEPIRNHETVRHLSESYRNNTQFHDDNSYSVEEPSLDNDVFLPPAPRMSLYKGITSSRIHGPPCGSINFDDYELEDCPHQPGHAQAGPSHRRSMPNGPVPCDCRRRDRATADPHFSWRKVPARAIEARKSMPRPWDRNRKC